MNKFEGSEIVPKTLKNEKIIKISSEIYIRVIQSPDFNKLKIDLETLKEKGINSLGICLMHSFSFNLHEQMVAELATHIGFSNVSVSSTIFPKISLVRRGNAALLDSYLNPIISNYLTRFSKGFSSESNSTGKKQHFILTNS